MTSAQFQKRSGAPDPSAERGRAHVPTPAFLQAWLGQATWSYPGISQLLPVMYRHWIRQRSPETPAGRRNFIRKSMALPYSPVPMPPGLWPSPMLGLPMARGAT